MEYLILFKLDNTVAKSIQSHSTVASRWAVCSLKTASCATVEPSNHRAAPLNGWVHRGSVLLFDSGWDYFNDLSIIIVLYTDAVILRTERVRLRLDARSAAYYYSDVDGLHRSITQNLRPSFIPKYSVVVRTCSPYW